MYCKPLQVPSPSQDHDPDVSGLYEITEKWLRTQVGNHRYAYGTQLRIWNLPVHTHIDHTRTQTRQQTKSTHQHEHHLSSRLWILFFFLLVGMSPNTCSGARVRKRKKPRLNPTPRKKPRLNPTPGTTPKLVSSCNITVDCHFLSC